MPSCPIRQTASSSCRTPDRFDFQQQGLFHDEKTPEAQYSERKFSFVGAGGTSSAIVDSPFITLTQDLGLFNARYFDATDPEERNNRQITGNLTYIAERGGRIHLQSIPNTTALAIHPILQDRISPDTDRFSTDGANVYGDAFPKGKHQKTKHKFEVKQKGFIESTRTIESAFSLFKRGIVGSYHKMSRDHMDSYLQEFCWRFNRRHMQEHLFDLALQNFSEHKPLTFKRLTREIF
jgi:transposase-like protein